MKQSTSSELVSVVIPCYNQARFLGQAIESVLAQTCPASQIIVVDDGSVDDTVQVATRYDSVQCLSQPNRGQGAARNAGLAHVTGNHVVFLDSDDRLLPRAFEIALQQFSDHPLSALVAGRCVCIGQDGVQRYTRQQSVVECDHYRTLLTRNIIWMPGAAMFRTEVVRALGGFKTTVSGAEDYDLYLRIARHQRIRCHDQVVAEYRQHETSTSRQSMQMMRSTLTVMQRQRAVVKGDQSAERALRQGLRSSGHKYGDQLMNTIRKQLRAHEWRQALSALLGLLHYHPRGFFQHAWRKASRVALGHKPETYDAIGR
jgi:glycosyltransferase involved in cell wall biosynthesis